MNRGIVLINLGSPDSASVRDVRRYLHQFLMDERVLDIPYISRFFLVHAVIAPFRAPKSAKVYKELWDERGSPLLYYSQDQQKLLQEDI